MSTAIIRTGGKQFQVESGSTVRVPLLNNEVGASLELEVLATTDGKETRVGKSLAEGAMVKATVVGHDRASKIIVFKKKRRKHYKRTKGHRQDFTTLKIESIG